MNQFDRITFDPHVLGGRACIRWKPPNEFGGYHKKSAQADYQRVAGRVCFSILPCFSQGMNSLALVVREGNIVKVSCPGACGM